MKFRTVLATLAILATMFLAACTPPYRQAFEDAGKEKHWTHKQVLAAFAYYDRIGWAREVKEGSGQYVVIYGKVPTAKVDSQIDTVLQDLNSSLDPNNAEMRQYLDTFGLRKDLEHEEEVTEAQKARVHTSYLYNQFQEKMGDRPESGHEAEMAGGYNIRKIFTTKDLSEAFPFKSDEIEGAKKVGSLKEIETAELDFSSPYDHKVSDPAHPDDSEAFLWKAKKMSIRLTDYKIITEDQPQNNKGNYIEGYRVIDGKQESKPALKIFFPSGGYGAVVLIDTDREGRDAGFGLPDILESVSNIENVQDVIRDGNLLATLFADKKKDNRQLPPQNLFKIEISRTDKPIDPWEKSPDADGWIVPYKYVTATGENFNIRIKFKKPQMKEDNPGYPDGDHEHSMYRQIEYIAKEYTKVGKRYTASAGQVVEYYRPKGEFAGKVEAKQVEEYDRENGNVRKIRFEFEDGSEVTGLVTAGSNKFIEDTPYAKSFTEGSQRWWVESSATNGKFDKRKKVSPPKERTGEYDDYSDESYSAENGQSHSTMDMDKPVVKIQRETQQAPPNSKQ
jgi:hypothetical protein